MTTDPTAQPSAPPIPRHRRWPRRLALGTAIMLVVLLSAHLLWYVVASADLAEARAISAAAGLSDDPALVIPPPCADEDNAALRYLRAYRLLSPPNSPSPQNPVADDRLEDLLSRADVPAQRETLITSKGSATLALLDHEDFRRAWTLLAEAARLPRYRVHLDYEAGAALLLPHLGQLRTLSRLGNLRARVLAAQGREQEAADQFADLLWLARHGREEPILISLLLAISMERTTLDDLRLALEQPGFAAVDHRRIRQALADERYATVWRRAMQSEFTLFGCKAFRDLPSAAGGFAAALGSDETLKWHLYGSWLGAPLRAHDEAAYHRLFAESYLRPLPPGDGMEPNWRHPLTSMLMPALGKTKQVLDLALEQVAAAQLALLATSGGTPVATADLAVERTADGGWIISHLPKPGRSASDQKKLLPWRVPPRR